MQAVMDKIVQLLHFFEEMRKLSLSGGMQNSAFLSEHLRTPLLRIEKAS